MQSHILSIILFTPLVGALVLLFVPKENKDAIRWIANIFALGGFLISLPLVPMFWAQRFEPGFKFLEGTTNNWIPSIGAGYTLGIDGISFLLIMLTTLLGWISILSSWTAIEIRVKEYYVWFLVLQTGMLGVFMALDFFLFFVFWEAMLVPMYLLIGIWGGPNKLYAAIKFFLYTLLGSVLMLLGILFLYFHHHTVTNVFTFSIPELYKTAPLIPFHYAIWLFVAFFIGFAIKVPMFPFHTWLPDAHVEAPTAGSVILAGVLLKMGTYGFMKLAFPLFPDATRLLAPVFGTLAVVSIIYGACLALVQTDIKKIIAYSSISHLGYVMLGLISLDLLGIQGAMMQMVSHGLVAGGLFLMVGMIYERCHTRELAAYGGLAKLLPVYSVYLAVLTLAAIGLPTTSGFTGEFLVLLGAFRAAWPQYVQGAAYPLIVSASAVAGVVLGALYMLWFAQRLLFGPAKAPHLPLVDLNLREKAILASLVIAVFALGLFPDEPMRKTELAARQYQQLVSTDRTGVRMAS